MEIRRCQKNGKPGFKAGYEGVCYTYKPGDKASRTKARRLAEADAREKDKK